MNPWSERHDLHYCGMSIPMPVRYLQFITASDLFPAHEDLTINFYSGQLTNNITISTAEKATYQALAHPWSLDSVLDLPFQAKRVMPYAGTFSTNAI